MNIPQTWIEIKIKEICVVRRGASPRPIGDKFFFSNEERGWIRISDVTNTYLQKTKQYQN